MESRFACKYVILFLGGENYNILKQIQNTVKPRITLLWYFIYCFWYAMVNFCNLPLHQAVTHFLTFPFPFFQGCRHI